jgi:hypothetical protein
MRVMGFLGGRRLENAGHVVGAAVAVFLDAEQGLMHGSRVAAVANDQVHCGHKRMRLALFVRHLMHEPVARERGLKSSADPIRIWPPHKADVTGARFPAEHHFGHPRDPARFFHLCSTHLSKQVDGNTLERRLSVKLCQFLFGLGSGASAAELDDAEAFFAEVGEVG